MGLGISYAVRMSGRLVDLAKTTLTLELREQIMQLREAVLNAQEEILSLRAELGDLKRATTDREQLKFDGTVYWREILGLEKEGPFCQSCLDINSAVIRLQKLPEGVGARWISAACKPTYEFQSRTGVSRPVKPHF